MSEIFWQSDTNFWTVVNGKIDTIELGTKTIAETEKCTPGGAYTTFRTYNSFGVLRLTKHLDRLEETARLAGHEIHIDRDDLKTTLTALVAGTPNSSDPTPERRIRVTVDLERNIGRFYFAMEPLAVPAPEKYEQGIICRTAKTHRENPKAKLSSFLSRAADIRKQEKDAFDEILMVSPEGNILEGLSSNFFGIIGDTVFTSEYGVLSGTTRDFILEIADNLNIPVIFLPVKLSEIGRLDEAFISSTSRSILPVRSIDGIIMKKDVPGPVTKKLMDKFSSKLKDGLEYLYDTDTETDRDWDTDWETDTDD